MMRKLVGNGANIGADVINGLNILHLAASTGEVRMLDYLIKECKMNTDPQCQKGWTPLHMAAENNHFDAVNYLMESGSALLRNDKGCTYFELIVEQDLDYLLNCVWGHAYNYADGMSK